MTVNQEAGHEIDTDGEAEIFGAIAQESPPFLLQSGLDGFKFDSWSDGIGTNPRCVLRFFC